MMTMKERYPTCALIVPTTATQLAEKARQAYKAFVSPNSPDDEALPQWLVVAGSKQHAALWDFDPAGDLFYELAPRISQLVEGKLYIAQLNERLFGSYAYEGGIGLGSLSENPNDLASRLGVPFPPRNSVSSSEEWSVCVVEGAGSEKLRSVLELPPEDRKVVRVETHPLGSIIFASDGSPVLGIGSMLTSPELEQTTTYCVERSRGDLVRIWISRKGKTVQFFTSDESLGPGPPTAERIWDIKGAKDIAGILSVLQIPPRLLGW